MPKIHIHIQSIPFITLMSLLLAHLISTNTAAGAENSDLILFNRTLRDEEDRGVFVLNVNTRQETRLTPPNALFAGSSWSNDGNRILVSQVIGFSRSLIVMDNDGGNQQTLTDPTQISPLSEQWTPDDKRIIFWGRTRQSNPENAYWAIFDVPADGGSLRQLTEPFQRSGGLTMSPDGEQIFFTQNGKLFIMSADGDDRKELAIPLHVGGILKWSPDGSQIANLAYSDDPSSSEIYTISPDGSKTRLLVKDLGSFSDLKWSPDGSELLFIADAKRYAGALLGFVNVETGVIDTYQVGEGVLSSLDQIYPATWSPDGSHIAFIARNPVDQSHNVYVVDRQVTQIERLTQTRFFETIVQWRHIQQ